MSSADQERIEPDRSIIAGPASILAICVFAWRFASNRHGRHNKTILAVLEKRGLLCRTLKDLFGLAPSAE